MNTEKINQYIQFIKSEISPAMGCTEPAAAALAAAYAANELIQPIVSLELKVSQSVFKNAMNVGIPGTGMIGLEIAGALGAISRDPDKSLMVLTNLSNEQKELAKQMVANNNIKISVADTDEKVYIEAIASDGENYVTAIIAQYHTNLILLKKNDTVLIQHTLEKQEVTSDIPTLSLNLDDIWKFTNSVESSDLEFLKDVISLNFAIAEEGLQGDYGLKVGKGMLNSNKAVLISNDIGNYAIALTAAAADARMAGCEKPVMSTAGSGNQGLTTSLPVYAVGYKINKSEDEIMRALAMSILVTIYTKQYIGRLSVLCGCSIAAAIGACCGIIYLLDGTFEQIKIGIKTMVADTSGVICDGAKPGCALKIATAVSSAIRCANMALNNMGASSYDGIVHDDVDKTLSNLGELGNKGMASTNSTILEMMLNKK